MLQGVEKHTLNDYIKYVRERNGVEKMSVYQKYRRLKRASDAAVAALALEPLFFFLVFVLFAIVLLPAIS